MYEPCVKGHALNVWLALEHDHSVRGGRLGYEYGLAAIGVSGGATVSATPRTVGTASCVRSGWGCVGTCFGAGA